MFGGLFIYDQSNKRSMIRYSNGMNYVPNLATLGGKIWGAITGICYLFMLIIPFWLTVSAFTTVDVDFGVNNITFKYMKYTETVDIDKIESYRLIDEFPKSQIRLNGIGSEEKSIGTFKVKDYGKSKLYLTGDNLPVLHIKTSEKSYFINSSKKVDIHSVFNKLNHLNNID